MNQAMMRRKITKKKLERILSILVAIIAAGNAVHAIVVMGMIRDGRSVSKAYKYLNMRLQSVPRTGLNKACCEAKFPI